jgi:hypothetical protein
MSGNTVFTALHNPSSKCATNLSVQALDVQLKSLSTAKTLFIEGTFEIVSKPFVQLLSIHFFDKHEDNMKQLTGVFVLMSRKKKKDY